MLSALLSTPSYAARASSADSILLVDFSGKDKAATFDWKANNDPVMGGQSHSTVKVENGHLNFTGTCAIVPSLKAPGFITAVAGNQFDLGDAASWKDVSGCEGLTITANSANAYAGWRLSFGHAHPIGGKFFAYGYKSHFTPSVGSMGAVSVPFSNFTDFWDDATGEPIHTCAETPRYCPDAKTLANMKTMSIWAEGVEGDVSILVEKIEGYGCK